MKNEILKPDRKALIPFVMAGYPSLEASLQHSLALIEEGVSAIEIGIPFSDPIADGPVIQNAATRALENGVNLEAVFSLVRKIKRRYPDFPIILFTYLNPILRYGLKAYARDAADAGGDATLCVDLPPEEAGEYVRLHRETKLKTVFLASPTTSRDRLRRIADLSEGFLYYVSRAGVTGETSHLSSTLAHELSLIRSQVSIPIAVGFGISNPEQAALAARDAEAVVIGSRFLTLMAKPETADFEIRDLARRSLLAMNTGSPK